MADSLAESALYASIDIGTNSAKMIVADLANGGAQLRFEQSAVTRLGEGMQAQTIRLREIPMRRTVEAVVEFVRSAHEWKVRAIVAVGTAALRDAENREDFLQRVRERCGLEVDVISGDEEARLSFLAVRRDPHWRSEPLLTVIDIGGGSAEVIQGEYGSDRIAARLSVNIGAVKLTETYLKSDPPTIAQLAAANRAAAEGFAKAPLSDAVQQSEPTVVGVGGTMTNLASMCLGGIKDPERIHGFAMTADDVEAQIERLSTRSMEQRLQIPGLDPRRADIILAGAVLLSQALGRLGCASVEISTRGLRWGALYDRFQ